jgi:putative transposase
VITRLTAEWQADYEAWQKRDLSARRYVYVWADGVYLQARMQAAAKCMLVLIGATPEGKKELVGWLLEGDRGGLSRAPGISAVGFTRPPTC